MDQVLSSILRSLRWNWKPDRSRGSRDHYIGDHVDDDDDDQTQTQLILPVQLQHHHPIIDYPDPPHVDGWHQQLLPGLLSVESIDHVHNQRAISISDVTTSERVVGTKRIGPYTYSQKILLVGEGDFSFSASLAVAFGSATNMIATSLNTKEFLFTNYAYFSSNKTKLEIRGCTVLHGIDATQMATHPQLSHLKFDCIVFNFPHSGFGSDDESTITETRRHQKLVSGFLRNAKKMISDNGQIHIRHKCNDFFLKWDIPKLGFDQGLFLMQEANFQRSMFPGYHTKYGFGGDKNFNCHPSKTYMFII